MGPAGPVTPTTVVLPAMLTENTAAGPCRHTLRQSSKPSPRAIRCDALWTNSVAAGSHWCGPLCRSRSPWKESCVVLIRASCAGRSAGLRGSASRQRQARARRSFRLGRMPEALGPVDSGTTALRTTPVRGSSLPRWAGRESKGAEAAGAAASLPGRGGSRGFVTSPDPWQRGPGQQVLLAAARRCTTASAALCTPRSLVTIARHDRPSPGDRDVLQHLRVRPLYHAARRQPTLRSARETFAVDRIAMLHRLFHRTAQSVALPR